MAFDHREFERLLGEVESLEMMVKASDKVHTFTIQKELPLFLASHNDDAPELISQRRNELLRARTGYSRAVYELIGYVSHNPLNLTVEAEVENNRFFGIKVASTDIENRDSLYRVLAFLDFVANSSRSSNIGTQMEERIAHNSVFSDLKEAETREHAILCYHQVNMGSQLTLPHLRKAGDYVTIDLSSRVVGGVSAQPSPELEKIPHYDRETYLQFMRGIKEFAALAPVTVQFSTNSPSSSQAAK